MNNPFMIPQMVEELDKTRYNLILLLDIANFLESKFILDNFV